MTNHITIIGAGLAGYQLARELRKQNEEALLTIITADEGFFYSKPQLSTALTQKKTALTLPTANAESMAAQLKAVIKTQKKVTALDTQQKRIDCEGESFSYDQCVLALGAEVIPHHLKGDAAQDVLSINHLYHYAAFEALIRDKKQITILGAGLIGCEFANDLTNAGYEVHVVAPSQTPLNLLLPEEIGKLLQQALEENGVHFHLGVMAKSIEKSARGYRLFLDNEEILETEFVLSAIGLRPHVELARKANIAIGKGILVNRYLETSAKEVYALGDCAEVEGHVLPYIAPLLNCARALASTLSGVKSAVVYPAMPIVVKTPAHPVVICPPPQNLSGHWEINKSEDGVRALFYDMKRELRGFILTKNAIKDRPALQKLIPGVF